MQDVLIVLGTELISEKSNQREPRLFIYIFFSVGISGQDSIFIYICFRQIRRKCALYSTASQNDILITAYDLNIRHIERLLSPLRQCHCLIPSLLSLHAENAEKNYVKETRRAFKVNMGGVMRETCRVFVLDQESKTTELHK